MGVQEGGGRLGGRKGGGEQHEAKAGALLHRPRRWCSRKHLVEASLGRLFRPHRVRRPAALCRLSRRLSAGAWIWRVEAAEGALEMFVRDGLWHTWPRLAT